MSLDNSHSKRHTLGQTYAHRVNPWRYRSSLYRVVNKSFIKTLLFYSMAAALLLEFVVLCLVALLSFTSCFYAKLSSDAVG